MEDGQTDGQVDGWRQRFYQVWDFLIALLTNLHFIPHAGGMEEFPKALEGMTHSGLCCSPSDQNDLEKARLSSEGRLPGTQPQ